MSDRSIDSEVEHPTANIIALAPNPWHGMRMNRQQLLSRLAARHFILYSNGPLHRVVRPGATWWPRTLEVDHVQVDLVPRWLSAALDHPRTATCVTRALAARWRRIVRRKGRPGRPLVAWIFHPRYWPFVNSIGADFLVYHAYDLYHRQSSWDRGLEAAEQQLVTRADLVVTSSAPIAEYLAGRGAARPLIVQNAAEFETFAIDTALTPVPVDLLAIPGPRIGYAGALNSKVDFALLAQLALRLPHCHFVLVGKLGRLDGAAAAGVARLRALPNAHFVGVKPYDQLPAYVAHMDVNLLAYRLSGDVWTEGIYPLKLHEYLATGKPVVSADLPSVRPFGHVVHLATSVDDWALGIAAALASPDDAVGACARRSVARSNDWSVRAALLDEHVGNLVR